MWWCTRDSWIVPRWTVPPSVAGSGSSPPAPGRSSATAGEYTGEAVGAGLSERDGLEQPVYYWLPSIAVWHSTEGGAGGALI